MFLLCYITIASDEIAQMITIQLSPELWRFGLLVGVLIFYKSAYKLVARIMDRLTLAFDTHSNSISKSSDPNKCSTSPLMSSLHRRFRSSASDTTPENMSPTESADAAPVTKSEAARSAKRFLLSTIRDDWQYPPSDHQAVANGPSREPLHYRSREEASSDPEPLSDEPYDARDPMVFTDSDAYKFESPDAVARTMTERKRKRRRLFKEELEWNEGLRHWVECRNAWCGAVGQRPKRPRATSDHHHEKGRPLSVATDLSSSLSPVSQISATSSSPVDSTLDDENDAESEALDEDDSLLLPVYPPLLPEDNPIRASIRPALYPAIYSKVVLQGLTPAVPIPLPNLVGALVAGWKEEGNWPPKSTASTTSIIQEGGRRASELLKLRRRENVVAEKGRMRKGVGAVKKALGLRSSSMDDSTGVALTFENGVKGRNSAEQSRTAREADPD